MTEPTHALVMVVDDQEANVRTVGALLTRAGFDVAPCFSGIEAIDRVAVGAPDVPDHLGCGDAAHPARHRQRRPQRQPIDQPSRELVPGSRRIHRHDPMDRRGYPLAFPDQDRIVPRPGADHRAAIGRCQAQRLLQIRDLIQ